MTRFIRIAVAFGAASSLVACSGANDPGSSGGTASATEDSSSDGFIFKGPMGPGGTITLTPLGPDLQPVPGAEVAETTVADWGGSYSVEVPNHQGLVLIEAVGAAFNEAEGAHDETQPVVLRAYGEVGERTSIHVNLITDLTSEALKEELLAGVPFSEAQPEVIAAFYDALPFTDRPEPEVLAHELQPHDTGYEQAWLFGFSSILAQALMKHPDEGPGSVADAEPEDIFGNLRNDFRDDWAFSDVALDLMFQSEMELNPDLAVLGLEEHHASNNTGLPIPDIHTFLDSDHDGILNDDDNCRYVYNPDQTSEADLPFGVACDTRLAALSVDEQWGCGLTANESDFGPAGSVVCWEVEGAKTGGAPPAPELFPGAANAPWGADNPFGGREGDSPRFFDIAVASDYGGDPWICASLQPPDSGPPPTTVCWDAARPEEPTPLAYVMDGLTISEEVVCGVLPGGDVVACFERSGALLYEVEEALTDISVVGASHMCGLNTDGLLECTDRLGSPVPTPAAVDGVPLSHLNANTALGDPFACGVTEADGSVVCFDLDTEAGLQAPPVPEGTGFVEVAVGLGTTCATHADGQVVCTRRTEDDPLVASGEAWACPEHAPPPGIATHVSVDQCQACGIGEKGFGVCWPSNWERARGEGEPIIQTAD